LRAPIAFLSPRGFFSFFATNRGIDVRKGALKHLT
jgi:hypothetical protein